MSKLIDLTGQRFGQLVVIARADEKAGRRIQWHARCDCGAVIKVRGTNLQSGNTTSCGRGHRKGTMNVRHGMSYTTTWVTWSNMKTRCYNPKATGYSDYGGRGIRMADRWLESFENFLADMGEKPPGMTIERRDPNQNYCPENCQWATPKEQQANTRRTHRITFQGITLHLSEWARRLGISEDTLGMRLKMRWSIERAFTTPVMTPSQSGLQTNRSKKKHRRLF